jgi:surface carbohydrate biosynthesis protein
MFAHHKPHIMEIRGESVNMLALFRALPKIHLGAVAYLEAYIDFVKPKLILSRTDNNHTLWQLKRRPNVTYQVALVQNGWRTRYVRSMSVGLSLNANSRVLKSDKYFVFGNNAIDVIKERVSANFEKIGNIVLNKFSFDSVSKKDKSTDGAQRVALISTFRSKEGEMNDTQQVVYESLNNFLTHRGYKLLIIGNALSVFEQKLESDFFSTVFSRTNYELGFFRNDNGSYNKLQSNKWIVSGHSTLGYESLVTGVPVGFILPSSEIFDDRDFESSSGLDRSGAFWCRSDDPYEHERVFAYLDNVSDEQWERDSGWIRDQLMVHDYGNTKIRAYVEGVLTDSLESK